jgi:hypothetical protein
MIKCKICGKEYRGEEYVVCGKCQDNFLKHLGITIPEFDDKIGEYVGDKQVVDRYIFLSKFVGVIAETVGVGQWNTEQIRKHSHTKRTIDVVLSETGHDL